jgi:stage 0 sporulation regulatory protein
MKIDCDCLNLFKDINDLRNQMIHSGLTKGLSHPETIKYSQKLDHLINLHQNFNKQDTNP